MNEWKVEFSSSECKALKKTLQVFTHRLHFVHCILSSSFGRKFGGLSIAARKERWNALRFHQLHLS